MKSKKRAKSNPTGSFTNGRVSGFTLIEMMIVVVLIAILASIALPAYGSYVNRAKIKSVQADLVALSLNFENEYQRRLSYPAAAMADIAALEAAYSGWSPTTEDFAFASTTALGGYSLTATGTSGAVTGCVVNLGKDGTKQITACGALGIAGDWL